MRNQSPILDHLFGGLATATGNLDDSLEMASKFNDKSRHLATVTQSAHACRQRGCAPDQVKIEMKTTS
jgi:hypothetical protein